MLKNYKKIKLGLLSVSAIAFFPFAIACSNQNYLPTRATPNPSNENPNQPPQTLPKQPEVDPNPSIEPSKPGDTKEYSTYNYQPSNNPNGRPIALKSDSVYIVNDKVRPIPGQENIFSYNPTITNKIPSNNNWDPSKSGDSSNYFYEATEKTAHTNLTKDELNRDVVTVNNEKYYVIAGQKIPANTPFVKYAHSNQAIKLNANGWATFSDKDFAKEQLPKTLFPKNKLNKNLENTVPTSQIHNIYRSSVSIITYNKAAPGKTAPYNSEGYRGGTAWILDYQKTDDKTYPLVWYFATNAHVARNLYNNQSYGNYGTRADATNLETIETKLISFQKNLDGNFKEPHWTDNGRSDVFEANIAKNKAKVLYIGDDFLKTKPYDFFPNKYGSDDEEVADFAVIEITFDNEEQAKKTTHNYANWSDDQKWKFRKMSYLANPAKADDPKFYVAGFPAAGKGTTGKENPLIRNNKRDSQNSLNPNLDENVKISNEIQQNGSPFSNSRYHTNFEGYKGIIDPSISISNLSFDVYGKKYFINGLSYALRDATMGEGSSGSMVVNRDNEIVAIHFGEWEDSDVGISMALVSERYIFSNIQDKYIPEYDLINGGGADQKTSYKDALKAAKKSNNNFKSYLFPEGLN